MSAKVDEFGKLIRIADDGLVRLDGIPMFRTIKRGDKVYVQFCDGDRLRIKCRGTRLVEVPLDILVALINPQPDTAGGQND